MTEDMKFTALLEESRKEVVEDYFHKSKMGLGGK